MRIVSEMVRLGMDAARLYGEGGGRRKEEGGAVEPS